MTSINLSPPTFFPGINMLFQAQNLRCRFGVLPEISDLEGKDSRSHLGNFPVHGG